MSITSRPFGHTRAGDAVTCYTLSNAAGCSVSIIDFGGIVTSILTPDKHGVPADIALGFDTLEPYLVDHGCMGDTVGRYGNRIGAGRFTLDGETHQLALNNSKNHLHGGFHGFAHKMFKGETACDERGDTLTLRCISPDGEEHYPGTLRVRVDFTLTPIGDLVIRYRAQTDRPTLCNLTNHTYFNLAGHNHGTIADHVLTIESDAITPVDDGLIPTGSYMPVVGTPFDMRRGLLLGQGLAQTDSCPQMALAGGYDHNYVLRKGTAFGMAARLEHAPSGRVMEVLTDQPGVQLYTACVTDYTGGKGGASYGKYSALCLETQHFPDHPNNPQFIGTTVLRPGETYDTTTIYSFRTVG